MNFKEEGIDKMFQPESSRIEIFEMRLIDRAKHQAAVGYGNADILSKNCHFTASQDEEDVLTIRPSK